jgi:DNA-binding Xre family transcriptional regulator
MKNKYIGSSFDSFLEEEGIREDVMAGAVKRILAYQLQAEIAARHITKTELAQQLETSRAAVNRLLDPENDAVTLQTLKRAASLLGKRIRLELV